jgi:hypothetical protein
VEANDTRNQHFLTRVEQKLNALNPNADGRNLRIYSFEIVDRENYAASRISTTLKCAAFNRASSSSTSGIRSSSIHFP